MGHKSLLHGHDGEFISDSRLVAAMLVKCTRCGVLGPRAKLDQHDRIDHAGEPRLPRHYRPEVPGRFKYILKVLGKRSERTDGQMIEAALEEWLKGRMPVGFRKRVSSRTHWGDVA